MVVQRAVNVGGLHGADDGVGGRVLAHPQRLGEGVLRPLGRVVVHVNNGYRERYCKQNILTCNILSCIQQTSNLINDKLPKTMDPIECLKLVCGSKQCLPISIHCHQFFQMATT